MTRLERLAGHLTREIGMRLDARNMSALEAAVRRAGLGEDAGADLDAATWQRLVDEVTVKETFFFRDPAQLATIDWAGLLDSARGRGADHVRVWSAACASGEEAYTLALLATERLGGDPSPVRVLGTDISTAALEAARRGRYGARALRGTEVAPFRRQLVPSGEGFEVVPAIRELVRFEPHNLAAGPWPPAGHGLFDLIVCRNVLIYFEERVVEQVVASLAGALHRGGRLMLGSADALCLVRRHVRDAPSAASRARRRRHPRPAGRAGPTTTECGRAAEEGLIDDPMDPTRHFLQGMAELACGEAESAVASFRRALYIDGGFAVAAFQLGRAHDAAGDPIAARRAYQQALRTFDPDDDRYSWLFGGGDIADVAAACRARLTAS